jgi:hypothetical protein
LDLEQKVSRDVLEAELGALTEADLARTVTIRGQRLSVHAAGSRSSAHAAYHVGQFACWRGRLPRVVRV